MQRKTVIGHSGGYILEHRPHHPLAAKNGYVYQHRVVFHAARGNGPFACHVCGAEQSWATMHVDHLNDCPSDNRAENLAAACPSCNQMRGKAKMAATIRARYARLIDFQGESLSLNQWAQRIGISRNSLTRRLDAGWSVERALTEGRGRFGPQSASRPREPCRPS